MKKRQIELKSLPANWNALTLTQWKLLDGIRGRFVSKEGYLTKCFLALEGLAPLLYAERWRSFLSHIPIARNYLRMTGRQIDEIKEDYLQIGAPFYAWKQCYRFKGFRNALFGDRFWMTDEELHAFMLRLDFLNTPPRLIVNPVSRKRIGFRTYTSYYTKLADMPWIDYNKCNMYYEQYMMTKRPVFLEQFLCVLYKIKDPKRVKGAFSEFEVRLILLFWEGVHQSFSADFPNLFKSKKKDKKAVDYLKSESEITVFISKLASTTPDNSRKILVYDVFQYLEQNIQECERLKMPSQKGK